MLSGTIPENIGNLKELTLLHLDENNLSGGIPVKLGDCEKLEELSMSKNELEGEIPESLEKLTNLKKFHIESNQLTGSFPEKIDDSDIVLLYNKNNGLEAQTRQVAQEEEMEAIKDCWTKMGGKLETLGVVGVKDGEEGEEEDPKTWKGITFKGYRIDVIGKDRWDRAASRVRSRQ